MEIRKVVGLVMCVGCFVLGCAKVGNLPPVELIEGNMLDTEVSLSYVITKAEVFDTIHGYAELKVEGKALKIYNGNALKPEESFEYYEIWEKQNTEGKLEYLINTKKIGSFTLIDNKYTVADVGYVFDYTKQLDKIFSQIASKLKNRETVITK